MVEAASKGFVLMVAKEAINDALLVAGVSPVMAGVLAGAGGGVAQVAVMGPCTFLVTAKVVSAKAGGGGAASVTTAQRVRDVYSTKGVAGFYPGGTALAFRQATNWASRQGLTEAARGRLLARKSGLGDVPGAAKPKLSGAEEVLAGTVGGVLSCWNHPFEVARIEVRPG